MSYHLEIFNADSTMGAKLGEHKRRKEQSDESINNHFAFLTLTPCLSCFYFVIALMPWDSISLRNLK